MLSSVVFSQLHWNALFSPCLLTETFAYVLTNPSFNCADWLKKGPPLLTPMKTAPWQSRNPSQTKMKTIQRTVNPKRMKASPILVSKLAWNVKDLHSRKIKFQRKAIEKKLKCDMHQVLNLDSWQKCAQNRMDLWMRPASQFPLPPALNPKFLPTELDTPPGSDWWFAYRCSQFLHVPLGSLDGAIGVYFFPIAMKVLVQFCIRKYFGHL